MAQYEKTFHALSLLNNVIATLSLAALTALGIYVNLNRIVIGDVATHGYRVADLDLTYWNVACTIIGTAVGLIAAVAFANQDGDITRHELASDHGVKAMFLRPLSIKRGADQIFRLQFPIWRTSLLLLTITTALTSAAVVALFGIHAVTDEIVNPEASYPLASLNGTFFTQDQDGGVFGAGSPTWVSQNSKLSGFLYKAAYIQGLKMRDEYNPFDLYDPYLPEQGLLGDTTYENLNTGGIGVNMSSYLQNCGTPSGFDMPAKYEFNKLRANVFGTHVNVSCHNVTSQYQVTQARVDAAGVDVALVGKPGGRNFTFLSTLPEITYLAIGSMVDVNSQTGVPTQTIAIPAQFDSAFVLECTYSGQEYMADVSVSSAVSPIHIERQTQTGPSIGPYVQQTLANMTNGLLAGVGGNLAKGFLDSTYNTYGDNNTDMATAIETVFGQLGEAYFSILRQQVERSNMYKGDTTLNDENGSKLRLYVTIQRLGGAQFGWLAVLGALLIGSILGVIQSCISRATLHLDAQDAVRLLQVSMQNQHIHDTTRVRYQSGSLVGEEGSPLRPSSVAEEVVHSDLSTKDPRS